MIFLWCPFLGFENILVLDNVMRSFLQISLVVFLGSGKFIHFSEYHNLSSEHYVISWTTINVNVKRYLLT